MSEYQYYKYPNRRLYDRQLSCYVTLADVRQQVLNGVRVRVIHRKSQTDITREVLLDVLKACETDQPRLDVTQLETLIRSETP